MRNQVKIWMILFAVSTLILTACKKDELTINPLEQFASEQNDEFGNSNRTCGLQQHMDKLKTDPAYNEAHQAKFTRLENALTNVEERAACTTPKVIPVAVHFQGVNGADIACLRQLAQSQIDILNNDYGGTNSDITKWDNQAASSFPGISNGDACIRFCIADKNHPSGFGLNNGTPAVTLNQTSGDNNSQWSGYLNIYVRPNTGVLGYSPLGGSGNGDGVVIDAVGFGAGNGCGSISPQSPYNLGRTLTHELGHYLLLDHIWGNGCNQDDGVADTPDQASDNNGCPSLSTSSCGSRDMHMNYMDYTNDACMYMFSAGQVARMEGYVNSSLANLTNNAANKCSEVTDEEEEEEEEETCNAPTQVNATNIASTQAKITWSASTGATNYHLRYRKSGTTSWTNKYTTATSKTITALTAGTTYQYQVRAKCSTWTGFTSLKTFTTTTNQTCSSPAQTNATNITASKAKITWSAVSGATNYRLIYRKSGTTGWTNKYTTATSKTITGLAANTTYQYRVRAKCSTWTSWTPVKTFTTTGGGNGCNGQEVTIKLVLDDYGTETSWELVNASNNTVATGGPYADNQAGAVKSKTVCVPNGCYTLYLDDAYGDGICCDYGDGNLEVIHNASVIGSSDGYFGHYDVIDFCVDNSNIVVTGQNTDAKVISTRKKTSVD